MRFIRNIIFQIVSNVIAILIAARFIDGFAFSGDFIALITTAAILTAINSILRPVLKLLFGPLIVLTFGLFALLINAATLYLLDILSEPLIIQGYLPLLIATFLFGVVNAVISFSAKSKGSV